MSVRLGVILCQAAGGTAAGRDLEGDLVNRLLGSPGLDLSLVGPLESLDPKGTDRLLLGGLLGDLAILSWHAPERALEFCYASGVRGYRARHELDRNGCTSPADSTQPVAIAADHSGAQSAHGPAGATATDSRRLYLFDLREHTSEELVSGLRQLLQARQTQTVPLSLGGKPLSAPIRANVDAGARQEIGVSDKLTTSRASESPSQPLTEPRPATSTNPDSARSNQQPVSRKPREVEGTTEWDQLVEDLNELDI